MMCKMSKRQHWHLQMAPADSVPPNCLLIHSKWLAPCTFYQPPFLGFVPRSMFDSLQDWEGIRIPSGINNTSNTWKKKKKIASRLCLARDLMDHGTRLWQNSNRDTLPRPAVVGVRRSDKPGGLEPKHLLPDYSQNPRIHLNESWDAQRHIPPLIP